MSPRALRALAVLVAALAVAVALDRAPPGRVMASDRVLPLVVDLVVRVELIRPGAPAVVLGRAAPGDRWRVDGQPADDAAVRDLLGALETLAWRRRVPAGAPAARGLDAPGLRIAVVDAGGRRELAVGGREPALGLVWVGDGHSDYLVEESGARALDRTPAELRRRRVFELDVVGHLRLERAGAALELDGSPLCVAAPIGQGRGCAVADGRRVAALLDRLGELTLTRFLDAAPPGEPELAISAGAETLAVLGACPAPGASGERAVRSAAGDGCLAGAEVAPLSAESIEPLDWVERRIVSLDPGAVDRVVIGGAILERRGGDWRRGDTTLSPEAVRDWLGALASYEGVPSWEAPRPPPPGSVEIELAAAGRAESIWLAAQQPVVRRRGEPLALRVHPSVRAVFAPDPVTLLDRRLAEIDPSTVSEIDIEEPAAPVESAARGVTLDDWHLVAPAAMAADLDAVDHMRRALSPLTAAAVVAGSAAPEHGLDPPRRTLTIVTEAAPGETAGGRRRFELGARDDAGCFARAGGRPLVYRLRAGSCAALSAHLAGRGVVAAPIEDVTAVSVGGRRLERHGTAWHLASGARASDRDARQLSSLVRALARAPAVAGYGPPPGGVPVVIEAAGEKVELRVARDVYARIDRPVRYRTPPEACAVVGCR